MSVRMYACMSASLKLSVSKTKGDRGVVSYWEPVGKCAKADK